MVILSTVKITQNTVITAAVTEKVCRGRVRLRALPNFKFSKAKYKDVKNMGSGV